MNAAFRIVISREIVLVANVFVNRAGWDLTVTYVSSSSKQISNWVYLNMHFNLLLYLNQIIKLSNSNSFVVPGDCLDRECSNHGTCSNGKCFCDVGWTGEICDERNDRIFRCLPDCSEHGTFDLSTGHCSCHGSWTGLFCNISRRERNIEGNINIFFSAICNLNCGPHGKCEKNQCICDDGWSGTYCDIKTCNGRCEEHGQCMNGTCVCQQGWNGR